MNEKNRPPKVMSTTLGLVLLAGSAGSSGAFAAAPSPSPEADGPTLVEWSSEEVKAFYDPEQDWNLPELSEKEEEEGSSGGGGGTSSSGGTTVIHTGGGFGWDDMLLYHLIFNRGSGYSSSGWGASHPAYHASTGAPYKRSTYDSSRFQNRPTVGSSVRPKTSSGSGSITRRSNSASKGSVGGNSSGYSGSSGKSSGFGG
ncbi:hypothetical protein M3223_00575 [Paenibacillus pasadenensis]|uniref:hypothetical protein n=1 Tax=Paenibacillus pasadenensis TaxID=217090 RepID=UPI00203FFCF9|nr:hypothetical protein [Paenibacillus pasadenensis]MCM3745837.1 hypothetical protein [Paenibacillus pasadenensis]